MAFGSYEAGVIQRTPVPRLSDADRDALAILARRAWSLKRRLDTTSETSHAFLLPPGLNEEVTGLDRIAVERELSAIQNEIDDRAFALYGIGADDRLAIEASLTGQATNVGSVEETEGEDGKRPMTKPSRPRRRTLSYHGLSASRSTLR